MTVAVLALAWHATVAASPADTLQARGGWYGGVEGGVPLGVGTFTSFGHDKTRAGFDAGVYGGYRFGPVLSTELSLKWGATSLSARGCCVDAGYWLGQDGTRRYAPVAGMDGWDYADLWSDVSLQQYGARLNVNILGFFSRTKTGRWSLDASPALCAVGTKAVVKTIAGNKKVLQHGTKWHLGCGGRVMAGCRITRNLGVGLYSEIAALSGKGLDGMPEHKHSSNLVWESGVRVGWAFGNGSRGKTDDAVPVTLPMASGVAVCAEEPKRTADVVEAERNDTAIVAAAPTAPAVETANLREEAAPVFPEVYFSFDSYAISKNELPKLQTILDLLNEHPDTDVTLNGWCDSHGDTTVNKRMSLLRAEAVKAWLVSRGIDAGRISAVGNGSERGKPDASKARRVDTETERKEARR